LTSPVIETSTAYQIIEIRNSANPSPPTKNTEILPAGTLTAKIIEQSSGWSIDIAPPLPGHFQLQNALNAIATARALNQIGYSISDQAIRTGIAATKWPGRLEKLQSHPDLYLDGAHNPSAARELAAYLAENFPGRKIWLIYGALRDKSVDEVAGWLFPLAAEVILTEPRTPRSISAAQLHEIAAHHAFHATVIADAEQALDFVLANATAADAIFITGSLYLVGQLRAYWKTKSRVAANSKTP
jgi:dihydrofolate synthase/folylpolyglutamate synthase